MPIDKNFTSIYSQDWKINFLQCYPNGYLKYTDLCNILQLTAGTHAELGGISFSDMQVHNQAWVLSKMRVEITKLPKWNDTITVKTWINSLENSRSIRCLEMYLGEEKIVGCETFWVVFNTNSRKPENLELPNAHFEKFSNNFATENRFSRIDSTNCNVIVATKKIVLSDLDIVNHANSVKYLEWCLDHVSYDVMERRLIKTLEMNYVKELSLNENINIKKNDNEETLIFNVLKKEQPSYILKLSFN